MKLFSLFTGIGGLEWGVNQSAEIVGFSEINKNSIKIFQKNHPSVKNYGDITRIDLKELPDFDILTGGFPCQSFSLAGHRKGFDDKRGKMIFYIYDIMKEKKPEFVVLENVKGIVHHNKGNTLRDVVTLLSYAGYYVRVVLLNAMYYGSAQNRERVFFLCSKKDFAVKVPEIKDDTKRFRDIKDKNREEYRFIPKDNERMLKKLKKEHDFQYELIGGYDRVGTIMTDGGGEKLVWDQENEWFRKLTVLECERLQGFPDGFTKGVADSARYFALGNAVNCSASYYLFNDYLKGLWWS